MLTSFFLNKQDSEALSDDLHQMQLQSMRAKAQQRNIAMDGLLTELEATNERIQKMRSFMEIQGAERAAYNKTLVELAGGEKSLSKVRYLRSRHFDQEVSDLLAKGTISTDPRSSPQWVDTLKYVQP